MSENKFKWHKYLEEFPPKEGLYLVTIDDDGKDEIDVLEYPDGFVYPNDYLPRTFITAWAELPEPYKEQKNDKRRID